jgi:hypothetical protein
MSLPLPPANANANVTIRAPRKCGHCRQPGHNVFTCGDLTVYVNTLYGDAIDQIQRDVLENGNGAIFERWVNELALETDMKYLVWRITNTKNTYDVLHSRTILFEHFASLDIGYFLPNMRRVRNYFRVLQIANLDVRYNSNGAELHNYLQNVLSESQIDDVYYKIMDNNANNTRISETFQREFEYWFNQPGFMSYKEFTIHCHFAGFGIGYNFHLVNIPGYNIQGRSRQREERRILRENVNEITTIVKPDLLTVVFTSHNNPYPIQQQIEYPLLYKPVTTTTVIDDESSVEEKDCCAICMDTKDKKEYLTTKCNHDFCSSCVGKMIIHCMQTSKKIDCPLCRTKLTSFTYCDENTIHNII